MLTYQLCAIIIEALACYCDWWSSFGKDLGGRVTGGWDTALFTPWYYSEMASC